MDPPERLTRLVRSSADHFAGSACPANFRVVAIAPVTQFLTRSIERNYLGPDEHIPGHSQAPPPHPESKGETGCHDRLPLWKDSPAGAE